jgi:hypothetical protein
MGVVNELNKDIYRDEEDAAFLHYLTTEGEDSGEEEEIDATL